MFERRKIYYESSKSYQKCFTIQVVNVTLYFSPCNKFVKVILFPFTFYFNLLILIGDRHFLLLNW